MIPGGKVAIADRLEPSIAVRGVAEQNVRCIGAELVPDAYDGIVGVGAADRFGDD